MTETKRASEGTGRTGVEREREREESHLELNEADGFNFLYD